MIFFLILVNIIVASFLSCSHANKGGPRPGQAASVSGPKIVDANRPFWAARGRRSGWTMASVDSAVEDAKTPNDDDYGYLEQGEDEPHQNIELWSSRLKRDNDNLPSMLIESVLDKTNNAENHSSPVASRPRRYSNSPSTFYGDSMPPRKPVNPFQEFFSIWLNQIKRSVAADSTTDVSRPFWAARG